jgi:hypothetical protein
MLELLTRREDVNEITDTELADDEIDELFDQTNLLMFVNCFENIMPYLADSLIFGPSRGTTLHKQFFERMKGKGEYRSWSRF